ncbi:Polynucleotide adenylyltransferase protein [Dioscorea alata]|uniref:Polynucleotide adenylyltransferase protein n=1 Tax=Dioscorea alata TaxID=55571 RepID=A0ACB7VFF3_DIOAL|nr:Polynucleotide adenylyltransferase protein [Dioscorea alata]
MGDLQGWLPRADGVAGELNPAPASPPAVENPHPMVIEAVRWRRAENATGAIIERIQPTRVSEDRRRAVVDYVQRLVKHFTGSEVFPFGSVPLKTYLPDGDIDLTALGMPHCEDALATEVRYVLEAEEKNKDAEFEVKDVQYINAEVKLVKCLVQNIVVDISFNQIGGLCTLCFLEKVDLVIGKKNLFKQSIILIKAWCYYESRILGAHHGLISTYALETLVLYIFHLFHSSLEGPLVVLYRFLDYYSKFDWDNYCISLHGPIPLSSLPELVAEVPENDGGELLLSKEFLRSSMDSFSVPPRPGENSPRAFMPKHLNIVDPLKENNNLGRSVSKGNFYRIRSAFTYGARKLGRILLLSEERIAEELSKFFTNTLERHGSGERPDVQDEPPFYTYGTIVDDDGFGPAPFDLRANKRKDDESTLQSPRAESYGVWEINRLKILGLDEDRGSRAQSGEHQFNHQIPVNYLQSHVKVEADGLADGNAVSRKRLTGDARDLATSRTNSSKNMAADTLKSPSNSETCLSPSSPAYYAPHHFFQPEDVVGNGPTKFGTEKYTRGFAQSDEFSILTQQDSHETESSGGTPSWISNNQGDSTSVSYIEEFTPSNWKIHQPENLSHVDIVSGSGDGNDNKSPKPTCLADLTGEFEIHYRSLLYAQSCHEFMLSGFGYPNHRSSPPPYRGKTSWDAFRRPNIYMPVNANGLVHGQPILHGHYPVSSPIAPSTYGEDLQKPRGTGTYFPNANSVNYRTYREKPTHGRGRASANILPRNRNNGRPMTPPDMSFQEKVSHDPPSPSQSPSLGLGGSGRGKPALLDIPQASRPTVKGVPQANGLVFPPDGRVELGSVPLGWSSLLEPGRRLDSVSPHSQSSASVILTPTAQKFVPSATSERPKQSYQLKDDDDFPPLSG